VLVVFSSLCSGFGEQPWTSFVLVLVFERRWFAHVHSPPTRARHGRSETRGRGHSRFMVERRGAPSARRLGVAGRTQCRLLPRNCAASEEMNLSHLLEELDGGISLSR